MEWCANLAYAIGLIAADGCLSNDGRHIELTSKDKEQIQTFSRALGLKNSIGLKKSGYNLLGNYFRIQFGNVKFYRFLLEIGLFPNKSKTLGPLKIPPLYFADFLRGYLDGDGNISVAKHPQSRLPQLRVRFSSASLLYLEWLRSCVKKSFDLKGGFIDNGISKSRAYYLVFSKADSVKLLRGMYYRGVDTYLSRKYNVALGFFSGEW
ncbi:MAG: hypothetical protein A2700_00360 [Candidatus Blackburnbacteria bacterium RIFCSPHIGHO2_01_FULL_44_64]|uniref:Homing endonuclease LAGLIDADG domain-containing protein n=1 Tax=Candidatus Blackburnbacteria bacterium RIFCSPHIGHO2_02_FULL_44_20 TaxID=1797516 RepID=A0A1G1V7W5_9BACT|nr:MAG: hypothetical protein A2700_00360 [Candidatus Blackburnbacteria bacterium RIFCSPHIGHO2_01_FULL_44_64]OGY10230.1 MAG: hypothetical protein A3E16_03405 [Candidatus Blackburnbacteria bacterium RIFCSPHIGHO2_12_FULL_44_25]OGY11371.1 MAG: hypothetical protein A3D26_02600 [Candidatus Blackburnbacteria bacterium RIFCSPHIGHO2_02_FULL_44_20]OGY13547.1 MAG: hypothetical protein A3A62_01025 [Candidatus Blackburnbacteria bacterium RIFCSPLOWO2_01_FULL_44_43]